MKSYIGYSIDADIRFKATSGGIGTSLIKWLFDNNIIGTSVSFEFDTTSLRYIPKMIHSFSEYKISGSIYQEIDLIGFIKSHVNEIRGAFACFTLPCQTRAVRAIVEKAGHETIIVGLACSSQQTLEATKYLVKRMGLTCKDVENIQYRGNGWPSGVQMSGKHGERIFVANNGSIWSEIFHSRLFIHRKCFMCQDTLNKFCDLTLADPWLKGFNKEKIGKTLVVCNSERGEKIIDQMCESEYLNLEEISYEEVEKSQIGTILRKKSYIQNKNLTECYIKILNNRLYRSLILNYSLMFKIHCRIKMKFEKYLLRKQQNLK